MDMVEGTLNLTHAHVQLYTLYHILLLPSTGIRALTTFTVSTMLEMIPNLIDMNTNFRYSQPN